MRYVDDDGYAVYNHCTTMAYSNDIVIQEMITVTDAYDIVILAKMLEYTREFPLLKWFINEDKVEKKLSKYKEKYR